MSVVIRLSRAGRVHLPYYHIGVYNSRTRRDGRPVEELGFYNPKSDKEPVRVDMERARYWIGVGAKPSATVATILKQQGMKSSDWSAKKLDAARKEKKAAARKAAAGKPAKKAAGDKPAKARKPRTATSKAKGEKKARAGA